MRRVTALLGAVALAASCGRWSSPPVVESIGEAGAPPGGGESGPGGQAGANGVEGGGQPGDGGGAAIGAGGRGGSGSSAGGSGGKGGARTGGTSGSTGGDESLAGQAGSGDAAGTGATETGGTSGGTTSGGSGGVGPVGPCGFIIDAALSPAISTVGVVEWSVTVPTVESASIEFGLDESYGMTAPVDLAEPGYRTLLLGMKASHDYHFRVLAHAAGEDCESPDQVLSTGPIANGLPKIAISNDAPAAHAGGFLVSSFINLGPAFILDADGDYVWWGGTGEMGRALMSYDGKYMWVGNINVHGGGARMRRVGMDGVTQEEHTEFGDSHHDFTVLPDETIGFIQHDGRSDRIMERAPDGSVTKIIEVADAHGGATDNHTNSIHYHPGDDTYTFSDLNQNTYVKVTRSGQVVWILGGTTSQFTGDGATWSREHGHHLIAPDRLLFFNNGKLPSPSRAVEVSLDFTTMTATRVWEYAASESSAIYGDVQRLDNGNTLVTYSTAGVIREVDPDGNAVQTLSFGIGSAVGYAMKRASLYGPPPDL